MTSIGDRIAIARASHGWDQTVLATKIGKFPEQISMWETGKRKPRPESLHLIAKVTGTNLQWLRTGEGEMMPQPTYREGAKAIREASGTPADPGGIGRQKKHRSLETSRQGTIDPRSTFPARLKLAMEAQGLNIAAIIRNGGPSRPTLFRILNEPSYLPEHYTTERLARALGISVDWLRTGQGEMLPNDTASHEPDFDSALMEQVIDLMEDYLTLFRKQLDPKQRRQLLERVYQMAKENGFSGSTPISMGKFQKLVKGA